MTRDDDLWRPFVHEVARLEGLLRPHAERILGPAYEARVDLGVVALAAIGWPIPLDRWTTSSIEALIRDYADDCVD